MGSVLCTGAVKTRQGTRARQLFSHMLAVRKPVVRIGANAWRARVAAGG